MKKTQNTPLLGPFNVILAQARVLLCQAFVDVHVMMALVVGTELS